MPRATSPLDAANQFRQHLASNLPPLISRGFRLAGTIPAKKPKLAHLIFISLEQRLLLWLNDVQEGYQCALGSGYCTAAVLARAMMETSTTIISLERDGYSSVLSAFLNDAESKAGTRRKELAKLISSKDAQVAKHATTETAQADSILSSLDNIRIRAGIPKSKTNFPNMHDRCAKLGDDWLFMYNALYRDLSEVVHSQFLKTAHAPSTAFGADQRDSPLFYEHTRVMTFAIHFWGISIVETCKNHPDQNAYVQFREGILNLLTAADRLLSTLQSSSAPHRITL